MATPIYKLPTISGNMSADVVRDMNALAEATDGAIKKAVDSVDLSNITQQIADVDSKLTTHLADNTIHITQADKNKLSSALQPNVLNSTSSTNLDTNYAARVFKHENWLSANTKEILHIVFPKIRFFGTLKITVTSSFDNSNAGGSIIATYDLGATGNDTFFVNNCVINHASVDTAAYFSIGEFFSNGGNYLVDVFKFPLGNNPITIKVEANSASSNAWDFVNNAFLAPIDTGQTSPVFNPNPQKGFDQRITENFTSVSNGKTAVANAITQMGVVTSATAEFATMAVNILNLSNIVSGTGTITNNGSQTFFNVSGLNFRPRAFMFRAKTGNIIGSFGSHNGAWDGNKFIVTIGSDTMGNVSSTFQGGFNVAVAYPNGAGTFDWWAIK